MVSKLTGVDISHYAEVDMDGLSAIVDAIGGVEVEVPLEIDDEDAGGYVPAGWQTLDGEHALIVCRSRNSYVETAAAPDLMRAANQRMVLSAIAHKVLASDIATIANSSIMSMESTNIASSEPPTNQHTRSTMGRSRKAPCDACRRNDLRFAI